MNGRTGERADGRTGKRLAVGVAILLSALYAGMAAAQAPQHWRVVREGNDQGAPEFVMMPPGWHITTGPAALLFDPRRVLEDRFTLATDLFLFAESKQEGYGIFVGGVGLEGNDTRYLSLQLRSDGSAAVIQMRGGAMTTIIDWKPIASVGPHPGKDTQRITMAIEVDSTTVRFTANGAEVGRIPRSGLDLAGHFGFRVGSGINLHVVGLDISEKLAPPRRR